MHVGQRSGPIFLETIDSSLQRDCSEDTAKEIDREVRKILDDAYADAKRILTDHRDQLDGVATELLVVENPDAAAFAKLIGRPVEVVEKKEPALTPPGDAGPTAPPALPVASA
ncbi:MAG: hypothetical protein IPK07_17225 [Deltaproteobacteria bacterium]|nr:hypothetical protein [Deltaproteobacteria bacterium]